MDIDYVSRFVELLSRYTEHPPPSCWDEHLEHGGRVLKGADMSTFPFHAGAEASVEEPANLDFDALGVAPDDHVLCLTLFTKDSSFDGNDTYLEYALASGEWHYNGHNGDPLSALEAEIERASASA